MAIPEHNMVLTRVNATIPPPSKVVAQEGLQQSKTNRPGIMCMVSHSGRKLKVACMHAMTARGASTRKQRESNVLSVPHPLLSGSTGWVHVCIANAAVCHLPVAIRSCTTWVVPNAHPCKRSANADCLSSVVSCMQSACVHAVTGPTGAACKRQPPSLSRHPPPIMNIHDR